MSDSGEEKARATLWHGVVGVDRYGFPVVSRKVTRVTRSPVSPVRWCVEMECGHEAWVTAKSKPAKKRWGCRVCGDNPQSRGLPR